MKKENVKIGMKVVPFKKSINGASLDASIVYSQMKKINQKYLYVTKYYNDGNIFVLDTCMSCSGDYFKAEDFYPYVENKIPKEILKKSQPISKHDVKRYNIKCTIKDGKFFTTSIKINGKKYSGIAKLHPDDNFSFSKGFEIASNKMFGQAKGDIEKIEKEINEKRIKEKPILPEFTAKDWVDFLNYKIVLNFATKEKMEECLKILSSMNLKTGNRNKPIDLLNYWSSYNIDTCINNDRDGLYFCDIDYYKQRGKTIKQWR